MAIKVLTENRKDKIFNSVMFEWVVHPEDDREYLYNINIAFDKVPEDWFVDNIDIPIAQDYSEWENEWDSERVEKTIEKELMKDLKELHPDITLYWVSIHHTNVSSYLIINLIPEGGDWADRWTEDLFLADEEVDIDFEEGAGLTENKDSLENRLRTQHFNKLIQEVDPQDIVEQLDTRDVNRAIRNRRNGGEDETGYGGLWDLAFEETLDYLFWEVGLDELTDGEHHEYTLLAEEVYNILVANEEDYVIELIWEANPNVIVQQIDIRDINKAIRSRRSGGEDEMGSGGLWDLAFEETEDYLYHEVGLDELTDGEHHEYTLLAEEVYNILIANEENYAKGRRPILDESKTLNEREGNNMSLEQRVKSVLDELSYLEKIGDYAYIYYYDKDYRDKLDPETIDDLIASAKSGDLTDAWYDLTSRFDDASYYNESITNEVVEALEKVAPLTDEEFDEVNQLIWDLIDIDYSTYLDDEVPVYIMVDTGDGNYDFTLNPNYRFSWDGETAEDEPLELASLTWLAGTQGYTLDQVLEAFREGRRDNKFLNSVVREGLENHASMTAVTFLGTMRILDLLNAASGNRDVTINADTYVGLFDTWSGSGSLFDIELEQGLVIPGNIINRIGTARGRGDNGYTPDHVYGFSGSAYDSKISLLKDLDRDALGESKTLTKDPLTEDVNFYGAKQGSEKADDILFALQAHYGLPKYDYDDFRKMNLTQEEVNEAIAYAERDELNKFTYFDSLTEDTVAFLDEMRYKDYVIEFFKDTRDGNYYWQAEYDGDDKKLSNFNVWISARGIRLYSQDENAYPTKANAVYEARKWIDEQKRRWEDPLNENKALNENITEDITEDNLTIVLNYVFNTDEDSDQYGDSFLYDIDIWKGNEQLYPITKPVYQTHEEMMNGDDYDIDYALRQVLQEAYPEYIIEYAGLIGDLYDMIAIINCLDEDGNHIDMEVPVKLEEIEDTAWDDETRLNFWV